MEKSICKLLEEPIIIINIGLVRFAESLEDQEVELVHVDWTPPAGGDQELMDLLDNIL